MGLILVDPAFAFGYGVYAILAVYLGKTVPGWVSLVASVVFLSGIQLMVLEYIGKMYMELKQRPMYLIVKTNITLPSDNKKQGSYSVNPLNQPSIWQGRRATVT